MHSIVANCYEIFKIELQNIILKQHTGVYLNIKTRHIIDFARVIILFDIK